MPAENINDATDSGYRRARVCWGAEDADIALVVEVHTDRLEQTSDEEKNPADGRPRGWRQHDVVLDREGINRLIRALRKARDAKYGRDE